MGTLTRPEPWAKVSYTTHHYYTLKLESRVSETSKTRVRVSQRRYTVPVRLVELLLCNAPLSRVSMVGFGGLSSFKSTKTHLVSTLQDHLRSGSTDVCRSTRVFTNNVIKWFKTPPIRRLRLTLSPPIDGNGIFRRHSKGTTTHEFGSGSCVARLCQQWWLH